MKKLSLIVVLLILGNHSKFMNAQSSSQNGPEGAQVTSKVNQPFSEINLSGLQTDIFLPQSTVLFKMPSADGAILYKSQADQVYFQLQKADVSGTLPSLQDYKNRMKDIHEKTTLVPISIIDLEYETVEESALTRGLILEKDGKYIINPSRTESPFTLNSTFAVSPYLESSCSEEVTFYIDETLIYTNKGPIREIEMDFGDGIGYRNITPGNSISVVFESVQRENEIKVRIKRDEKPSSSGSAMLKSASCSMVNSVISDPNPNQADLLGLGDNIYQYFYDFGFAVTVDNISQYASAYTLWSDDGVFDKPFIFVEGIDFGNEHSNENHRHGDFGWCEFVGNSSEYTMLDDMDDLLVELRADGYDLILLDFFDGADDIIRNSALLQDLIYRVNDAKVGDHPNVVAGASMGGQVTRHALKTMENNGVEHCTAMWVSLDSPHNGANVPIGLQDFLYIAASNSAAASNFIQNYLQRPAAKQLLFLQATPNPLYSQYYGTMDALGYPEKTINLGIANGNGNGTNLPITSGADLLNYECDAIALGINLGDAVRMFIAATPGSASHPDFDNNSPDERVTASYKYTEPQFPFNTSEITILRSLLAHPRYDVIPGGTRSSLLDLVNQTNPVLESNDCPGIESWQYESLHSFIPTASALGVSSYGFNTNYNELWNNNPDAFPFDFINMAEDNTNEAHSEITVAGPNNVKDFILFHIDGILGPLSGELTGNSPNNGFFNYGKSTDKRIPSLEVHNGAELHINKNVYVHYGNSQEYPDNLHHIMYTQGCGALIELYNNGLLEVGDETGIRTADLKVSSGCMVRIDNGGILRINENSKVIVESGAQLILSGGTLIMEGTAELIVQEGAELIFEEESSIQALDGESLLYVYGVINLGSGNNIEITASGDDYVLPVFGGAGVNVDGTNNARLEITGSNPDQLIMRVLLGGEFVPRWSLSEVELNNGKVQMSGDFRMQCKLDANNVTFTGSADIETETWFFMDDCTVESVDIEANLDGTVKMIAKNSSYLDDVRIEVTGGSLRFEDCEFIGDYTGSAIRSVDLEAAALVRSCTFETVDFGIEDYSNVRYYVKDCHFTDNHVGVSKSGGAIELKCNTFTDNWICGLEASGKCKVYMNSATGAGYNDFKDNDYHVLLNDAGYFRIEKGFNTFGESEFSKMQGTFDDPNCPGLGYSVVLDAAENAWSFGIDPVNPDQSDFSLETNNGCNVYLSAINPIVDAVCDEFSGDPHQVPSEKEISTDATADGISQVVVYPNPNLGQFELSLNVDEELLSLEIFDSRGRRLKSISLQNRSGKSTHFFNLDLATGMYILKLTTTSGKAYEDRLIID